MNNKVCYVSVGCPGSGKSTWFDSQDFDPMKTAYICMDDVREEITGDPSDQTQNALVAKLSKDRFKQALSLGVPNVIWDATSVIRKYRKEIIQLAKKAKYEVHCIYFDIPFEVACERNAKRERVVPLDVMHRMRDRLQVPEMDEGFDRIEVVEE